jgi:hypothetical protein
MEQPVEMNKKVNILIQGHMCYNWFQIIVLHIQNTN